VHLERADGRDQHRAVGREPGLAALDVEKLLAAEVGAEAGFARLSAQKKISQYNPVQSRFGGN
jgi:hypothetical protein